MGKVDQLIAGAQSQLTPDLAAVTVESALAPPFTIRPFAGGGDGGGGFDPGALVGFVLRPRVTVQTPFGPMVLAPYGEPPAFPWAGVVLAVGAVAVLGLAIYAISELAK